LVVTVAGGLAVGAGDLGQPTLAVVGVAAGALGRAAFGDVALGVVGPA